ncbi:S8 family serine peptidase [bacterium]|nr:S8 family serine peptidase [bacterium]
MLRKAWRRSALTILVVVAAAAAVAGQTITLKPTLTKEGIEQGIKLPEMQVTSNRVPSSISVGDFYMVDGKSVQLERADSEIAIQYGSRASLEKHYPALESSRALGDFDTVGRFHPKGVAIVQDRPGGKGMKARGAAELKALAEAQPGVEFVLPVYVNPTDKKRMIATDELSICLEKGSSTDLLEKGLARIGGVIFEKSSADYADIYHARLDNPLRNSPLDVSVEISSWPGVEWAEPNFIREMEFYYTPNDPLFSQQQYLHNTGANGAVSDADIDAPEAWDTTTGSSSIVIAIIDDGVDESHTDMNFDANGYDFYNSDSDPSPTGTDGHGTGCAGVAAAIGNNSYRTAGTAPGCTILAVKVADGSFGTNTIIANGIDHAATYADVLSNSWGGGSSSSEINTAITNAATNGRGGLGCPVFFASGNSASTWYQGGGRYRFSTSGLVGDFYYAFRYLKDVNTSSGSDLARVDNVCLIGSDEYTHTWRQDFEGSFPPTGWTLANSGSTNNWYRSSTDALVGTGGTYSATSGSISDSQWCELRTPLMTLTGAETFAFAASVSSEYNYDGLQVYVYDSSWGQLGYYGLLSGVPSVNTAVSYPASQADAIAVGSATDNDYRSSYSEYGSNLDFVAPSNGGWNDVWTLDPTGTVGWTSTDYKPNFGGTSSASPTAAGVAALMLSANGALTGSQVRTYMRDSCDEIGGVTYVGGFHNEYGYGRINANAAVALALAAPSPTPTPTPFCDAIPYTEGFEAGAVGAEWTISGTNTYRTQVTTANTPNSGSYHLTMDSTTNGSYARNEATLCVDLAGYENVVVQYYAKEFGDEADSTTSPFTGGADFDGLAMSGDGGTTWYVINDHTTLGSSYALQTVDLDAAIASAGISYSSEFKLRWNQYDNYQITTDGVAFDDISITGNVIQTPTPTPTPSDTPTATPSDTPSPTPSDTPSPTPSDTPSPTPSDTPSPTPSATPSPTPVPVPGDEDGDGEVHLLELNAVLLGFRGLGAVPASADIDPTDGVISLAELNAVILAYRATP